MSWLLRFKGWLAALGFLIVALATAFLKGNRQGRQAAKREQAAEAAKAQQKGVEARNDAKDEVNRLPDGGAADELRRDWVRDDDAG